MSTTLQHLQPNERWEALGNEVCETLLGHRPDLTLLAHSGPHIAAQASIWWRDVASLEGESTGAIGHFEASNQEAAIAVLQEAVTQLRKQGCRRIVGPMDGNTWRRYRLITQRGNEPPFFLEPNNPDEYPHYFETAGFVPLASYFSALDPENRQDDPRVDDAMNRLGERGISIRDIDLEDFETELARVHELSLTAFASNFMFSPIDRAEFVNSYRKVKPLVRPGMVLMAEAANELVGFMFTLPDINRAAMDTAIAKTVAVRPGRAGAGLGSILVERSRRAAREHGFHRLIYALMHDSNRSTRIAARFGAPFRRYALFVHAGPQ